MSFKAFFWEVYAKNHQYKYLAKMETIMFIFFCKKSCHGVHQSIFYDKEITIYLNTSDLFPYFCEDK